MKLSLQSLPTDILLCVLLLAASWTAANFWKDRVRSEERQKVLGELTVEWTKKLRSVESKAQREIVEQKEAHAQATHAINLRLSAALAELRKRPSRAEQQKPEAGSASRTPAPAACTGAGLAREDAEFLAWEAAAAAEQQARLIEAERDYETCRQALRSATNGKTEGDSDDRNGRGNDPPD